MAKKSTSELFGIEIETTRGTRERVWPEGGSELEASRVIVETWFHLYCGNIERGERVEDRAANGIRAVHLVRVPFVGVEAQKAETQATRYRARLQAVARRVQAERRAA
jgi:hypothetical protein